MTEDENSLSMAAETPINQAPGDGREQSGGVQASEDELADGQDGLTAAQLSDLQAKAAKADENWDRYVRAVADLDNYKKRALRERQDAIKYANEALVEKLLPIVDNFEAALLAANSPQATNVESLKMGVNMIYTQLKNLLAETGVEEIDAANKTFDPNLHEAVSQQPSTEVPEGQVLQQMRKGYRFRDRLLRPAMVIVAKKP